MAGAHYTSKVSWEGPKISAAVARGGRVGVTLAAERLKALSVPLAPIDTGALREAASVIPAKNEAVPEAALVFDTPYAAAQHEHEEYHHDDGQAKYVEEPLTSNARELQTIIGESIRRGLGNA